MVRVAAVTALLGCWHSCFAGSTLIATPAGSKKIRDLVVGDAIWSFDPVERRFAIGRVAAVHRARGAVRTVRTTAGAIGAVTESHPVFVPSRGFAAVSSLALADAMLHWSGEGAPREARVTGVEAVAAGDLVEVFNLTVADGYSTYFADGFLVHNKKDYVLDPIPTTQTTTSVVTVSMVLSRGALCPALCGASTAGQRVDACSTGTVSASPPHGDGRPATCAGAAPSDLAPCTTEAMTCTWSRPGDWCDTVNGTCKSGRWRTAACGSSAAPAPRPEICPTTTLPFGTFPECPSGVDQRCVLKTDASFCPEVEAYCFDGEWKGNWCRRDDSYFAVTCTVTSGP